MAKDKYSALWVSHSSMRDFLNCPRAYFLRNVYKDPRTGHKMTVMSPSLALGQVVHDVVEALSTIPVEERFVTDPLETYNNTWEKVSGKKGGFHSDEQEQRFKARGREMIQRVKKNPGPLKNLAVKISQELPHYWISEDDNIVLCGKIDWLEYLKDSDSVHIIDFKTSKKEESEDSLQLPIYLLLVKNTQKREVEKASYWYLDLDKGLKEQKLPDDKSAHDRVMKIAKELKLRKSLDKLDCLQGGCFYCEPLERVLKGEGEKVAESTYGQDIYILPMKSKEEKDDSVIL